MKPTGAAFQRLKPSPCVEGAPSQVPGKFAQTGDSHEYIYFTTGMSGWKQVVGRLPNTISPSTFLDAKSRDQGGSPGLCDN